PRPHQQLDQNQKQSRQDRPQTPHRRGIEEGNLYRRRRVHPGDGPEQDIAVHDKEKYDGCARGANDPGFPRLAPARVSDRLPKSEKEIYLGEHRRGLDNQAQGGKLHPGYYHGVTAQVGKCGQKITSFQDAPGNNLLTPASSYPSRGGVSAPAFQGPEPREIRGRKRGTRRQYSS